MIFKFKIIITLQIIASITILAAPEIILERPNTEKMTVYKSEVIFKGILKNGISLTINGLDIPLSVSGGFNYRVQLNSKNGNNYFLLEGSDGNQTTQLNRTIFYDSKNRQIGKRETPRQVAINQPRKMEQIIKSKKQLSYSKELTKLEMLDALRKYIGEKTRGSYGFHEINLNDFINIFAREHQVNIINNIEIEKTLSVELNDIHPADVFDTLISYWGCNWIMKDQIIKIVQQAPIRVFKLNYLQGSEFIKLVSNMSNITEFQTNPIDNSIVAQGPAEDLEYLQVLIEQLDVKPKQVLIEATIIETNFLLEILYPHP